MDQPRSRRPALRLAVAAIAAGLAASLAPSAGPADAAEPPARRTLETLGVAGDHPSRAEATRILVRYREGLGATARERSRSTAAVRAIRDVRPVAPGGVEVVRPAGDLRAALAALRADPAVVSAEPDHPRFSAAAPTTEPLVAYQWSLENDGSIPELGATTPDVDIDAFGAYARASGAGIVVAVIDDGLDFSHPDLVGQAWVNPGESGAGRETNGVDDDANGYVDDVNGVNVCDLDGTPASQLHVPGDDFHGTAVASVLAAASNDVGMAGVAPNARIMGIKFLWDDENLDVDPQCASDSYAIEAIDYAIAHGADVINASWGGPGAGDELELAIARARAAGVVVVAAAGNSSSGDPHYPAAYATPNVVSVGAIDPDGTPASYTNAGPWVDLAAPGTAMVVADVTDPADPWWAWTDGTSFAAPLVSGVAALTLQVRPDLRAAPDALASRLIGTGWRNGAVAAATSSGRVLDARYAVDAVPPGAIPYGPSFAPVTGTTLGTGSIAVRVAWPAASDDSGIGSYRLARSVDGGPWATVVNATTARRRDVAVPFSRTTRFQVAARDLGLNVGPGRTGPIVRPVVFQEGSLRYGGTWRTTSSTYASGKRIRYTTSPGAWVSLRFSGRGVALVAPTSSTRGRFKVYVDGRYVRTISLASSRSRSRQVLFGKSWSARGTHTLKLVALATAGRNRFDVDAFVVFR